MNRLGFLYAILCCITFISQCTAFASYKQIMMTRVKQPPTITRLKDGGLFDGLVEMVKYREACPPSVCIESLLASFARNLGSLELFHWAHPVIFSTSVIGLGGYGYVTGQKIRKFRAGDASVTQADFMTARRNHPIAMSTLFVLYLFGLQSGLASLLVLQKSLLESPHSLSAVISLTLLAVQAGLGSNMNSNENIREAHTLFSNVVILALVVHVVTGLQLGFSF